MTLKSVLNGIDFNSDGPIESTEISGLTCDSRAVARGDIFVAFRGYAENGHRYIEGAIKRGAAVIIAEEAFQAPPEISKIFVKDTRASLPALADNFYGQPSKNMTVIGVTGTNGKTTITYIIESIVKQSGQGAGVIGTVNYRFKDKILPAKNTTPGPIELQSILARMRDAGLKYAVMEVSSHSLDQHRVDSVRLDAAIFTNITNEHLDYHKTRDEYFNAKIKIFDRLKPGGYAILNMDDDRVALLKNSIKMKVLTFGIKGDADVRAEDIDLDINGSRFSVLTPYGKLEINTGLIGMHNISNILASIAASLAIGIDIDVIKKGVEAVNYIPGRLEQVVVGQRFKIFVDYAHTEDAMNNILSLLRGVAKNRIITVFGCGGNRDRQKRPLMGRAACRYSDRVIITSDNPRFEDPNKIIKEIESGIRSDFSNYEIVTDRRKAIEKALEAASANDIIVIAGKGHENYQIIKDRALPFDDCEIAREILSPEKRIK